HALSLHDALPILCPSTSVGDADGPQRCAKLLGEVAELALQGSTLIRTQPTHTARLCDVESLHDLLGTDLADTGQGFQQSRNLHLADDIVLEAFCEHLRQGDVTVLQLVLDLRSLFSGLGGFLESGCALFGCEGRKGHAGSPRFSTRL